MTRALDFKEEPPTIAYLDPSFLVNLLLSDAKFHKEVKEYSQRLKKKGTILILSHLGLDEIWFALLKAFAVRDYGLKRGFRKLTEDPETVKKYVEDIEKATTVILELPRLFVVEVTFERALGSLEFVKKYGLLPRDALHAYTTLAAGIHAMITTDADFARVEELSVYTCNPKALQR
ncbi:MAG: type II toxin-antitoxin system VapC family toxin [Candidatus Bipolaricaulia bacterium]